MSETTKTPSDSLAKVFEQVRAGNEDAASELYSRLKSRLVSYLRKNRVIGPHLRPDLCTTELVQDTLAKLFYAVAQDKFIYHGQRRLWAWLITVILHTIDDFNQLPRLVHCDPEDFPADKPSPDQLIELADMLRVICEGLDELAVRVFELWLEGYSQREIAERLDCDRRRVHRILELIAHRLYHRFFGGQEKGTQ